MADRRFDYTLNDSSPNTRSDMTKEKLVEIIQGLLNTDIDLDFLLQLKKKELELLVACVRHRLDEIGE